MGGLASAWPEECATRSSFRPEASVQGSAPTDPIEALRASVEDGIASALRDALPLLAADLEAAGDRSASGLHRNALYAASAALRLEPGRRVARVSFAPEGIVASAPGAAPEAAAAELSHTDEDDVEIRVLARALADAVKAADPEIHSRYESRSRGPLHGEAAPTQGLPATSTLALGVVRALDDLVGKPAVVASLRGALARRLAVPISRLLAHANEQRPAAAENPPETAGMTVAAVAAAAQPDRESDSGQQVTPDATAEAARTGAAPAAAPAGALDVSTLDSLATRLGTTGFPRPGAVAPGMVARAIAPVSDLERDAVAFAHSIGEIPYSRVARGRYFSNARQRLKDAAANAGQIGIVDVVAAMFDYVVDDRRLPEVAKPLVWRLQQPALALALLDSTYLGDEPRSLRRLIENFGAIATAFPDDITRGSELHRRLETVVRAVEIVTGALQSRSAVISAQVSKEYERAAVSVAQLIERVVRERQALESTPGRRNRRDYRRRPGREREQAATAQVERLLEDRLSGRDVPASVQDFLRKVWMRQLRTTALRDGEESAEFRVALQVVDDLLWSLGPVAADVASKVSRRELAERIPPLIQVLTQGLREIGAKEEEQQSFFDELFLIHLRRMQRHPAEVRRRVSDAAATGGGAAAAARPSASTSTATEYDVQPSVPTLRDALADESSELESAQAAGMQAVERPEEPPASVRTVGGTAGTPGEVGSDTTGAGPAPGQAPADDASSRTLAGPPRTEADPAEHGDANHRLLEILASLDLQDISRCGPRLGLNADAAIAALQRGTWVELVGREGEVRYHKVAWINRRRTVALLVRHPDRRAVSLRMSELRSRFDAGSAHLVSRIDG